MIETDSSLSVRAECASPSEWDSHIQDIDLIVLAPVGSISVDWKVPSTATGVTIPILYLVSQPMNQAPEYKDQPWGVLPATASSIQINLALHSLANGLWVGDPALLSTTVKLLDLRPESGPIIVESLTRREIDVLQCLALGFSNKKTSLELGISLQTVKYHISSIFSKLGVNSRTEAVRMGVRQGWVNL